MADVANPGDERGTDTVVLDDVSRRDLDLDAHPLPRRAPALSALLALRVVIVACAMAVVGVVVMWRPHAVVAVPLLLWALLWLIGLALFAHATSVGHRTERGLLRLERAAHPRFFAVVDDVCARLSIPAPQTLFLINESNAFNARVQRRSTVLLGFASLVASDVTALRSTLGHELGHHLADDTVDPAILAWAQLQALGEMGWLALPFSPLARRLAEAVKVDAMRRCRLNEHAADFWGGVAAGHDTTARCLAQDHRASLLWSALVDDVVVLREAGLRAADLYRCLREASRIADDEGFGVLPSQQGTDPLSTHPGDVARAVVVEERLRDLPRFTAGPDHAAVDLFDDGDAIGDDLSALFFDPEENGAGDWLEVVDDVRLWDCYAAALPDQLRGAFMAVGHPRLAEPTSSRVLFDEVRLLIEAGVRFSAFAHARDLPGVLVPARGVQIADPAGCVDVTSRLVGLLLDLLVIDGHLDGSMHFGALRTITVDGEWLFRVALAGRLTRGERWDDVADELTREARRRRDLRAWASHGFHVGDGGRNPFASSSSSSSSSSSYVAAPAWERDTEEVVLPVRADNSDRERSGDDVVVSAGRASGT